MTFEEHLQKHPRGDGTFDLHAAEVARADEIAKDPKQTEQLARKAAKAERDAYLKGETQRLRKQYLQPPLSTELDLEVKVPLGENVVVAYGDMNVDRIRIRKDLRTQTHLDEARAFDAEITHWFHTEKLLGPDQTIRDAVAGDEST